MSYRDSLKADMQRRCAKELLALDGSHRREVMAQLCFDRIGQKQEFLVDKFHDTESWMETAYLMLLRSLDIKANRKSYERLAKILPYRIIAKSGYGRTTVEALLLGSAGLLQRLSEVYDTDKDIVALKEIYDYESHKFALDRMTIEEWQLSGHAGDNHPVIRLLQLASVLSQHQLLLDDMLSCRTREDVERLFRNSGVPQWAFRFLSEESYGGAFTRAKAQMLGINVVAQLQIFYSEYTMRSDLDSRGLDLLESLPAEQNLFVSRWAKLGVKAENALESQALLQLTKEYCSPVACERCPLHRFLTAE